MKPHAVPHCRTPPMQSTGERQCLTLATVSHCFCPHRHAPRPLDRELLSAGFPTKLTINSPLPEKSPLLAIFGSFISSIFWGFHRTMFFSDSFGHSPPWFFYLIFVLFLVFNFLLDSPPWWSPTNSLAGSDLFSSPGSTSALHTFASSK